MKKALLFPLVCLISLSINAQSLSSEYLRTAAIAFMKTRQPANILQSAEPLLSEQQTLVGYLFHFAPTGFIVVSASEKILPVYAYSAESGFNLPAAEKTSLQRIITEDLTARILAAADFSADHRAAVEQAWTIFMQASPLKSTLPEQWPPSGTTNTGGWLTTNWTQSAPYNNMCPMDLNSGVRSVAGCPAIAMAQILNYHTEINQTRFDVSDDYFHNFGAGNSFWIDDDSLSHDFPGFHTLNLSLDTLESNFLYNTASLSNSLKAALCFACGVAAKQVFSASVSGTYGLEQAIMAFQRFGFQESRLVYPTDTTLNSLIAENVKVALPVHLGLICSDNSCGHNVVVDGYSSDGFYHFNFGWGGASNGWYTLPPTSIAYNLTIIEGAVLDIKSAQYTANPGIREVRDAVYLYPNPWKDDLMVAGLTGTAALSIHNLLGERVYSTVLHGRQTVIRPGAIPSNFYIYYITDKNGKMTTGKVVKK